MTLQMNSILPWAVMFLLIFTFSAIVHKRFKGRNVWDNIVKRYRENTDKKLLNEAEFVTRFGSIENNSILYTTEVDAGSTVVYLGPTPTKDTGYQTSWRFIGWDKDLTNITADTVFIAQFENYQDGGGGSGSFRLVTFRDYDGTVLDYDLFEIGKDVPLYLEGEVDEHDNPIVPTREDTGRGPFTFVGWSIPLDVVAELPKTLENSKVTVFALYTHGTEGYPIVFYRSPEDGKSLLYEHFLYSFGANSYYGGPQEDFLNPDYGFTGWDHDLTNVTESFNTFPTYDPEVA